MPPSHRPSPLAPRALGLLAGSLAISLLAPVASARAADDASVPEGQGIAPLPAGHATLADLPSSVEQKPLDDALTALHRLYVEEYLHGGAAAGSGGERSSLEARIEAAQAEVERMAGRPLSEVDPDPGRPTSDASAATLAARTSTSLPVRHSTQSTAYYCGPASVAMAIRASCSLCERSRYRSSDRIGQKTLAASRYLATTTSGTSMSRIPVTLKRWAGISSRLVASPSAATLRTGVVNAIGRHNRAVVYGTRELAGASNPHYNYHYRTFTIDHLIMGYGYSRSGSHLRYADPVAGRWTNTGQARAPRKTNAMAHTSMRTFTRPWGVVL